MNKRKVIKRVIYAILYVLVLWFLMWYPQHSEAVLDYLETETKKEMTSYLGVEIMTEATADYVYAKMIALGVNILNLVPYVILAIIILTSLISTILANKGEKVIGILLKLGLRGKNRSKDE